MELKEMIKVMQYYEDGGEVEYKRKHTDNPSWVLACPVWDWINFDYRIKKQKQKVTIGKWLLKDIDSGVYFIMESSDVNFTLKDFPKWRKLKLLETYEVEL